MIKRARAEDLIKEHALLRKQAFVAAQRETDALFRDAEAALRNCKVAEASAFDPHLLRHFTQP